MPLKLTLPWSNQAVLALIDLYRQHKCLYDFNSPNYHDQECRRRSLKHIAMKLQFHRNGTYWQDVRTKLQYMRTTFGSNYRKVRTSIQNSTSTDDIYKPTLWYYNNMMFLKNYIIPKKNYQTSSSQLRINKTSGEDDILNESMKNGNIDVQHNDFDIIIVYPEDLENLNDNETSVANFKNKRESYNTKRNMKSLSSSKGLNKDLPPPKRIKKTIDIIPKNSEETLSTNAQLSMVLHVQPLKLEYSVNQVWQKTINKKI